MTTYSPCEELKLWQAARQELMQAVGAKGMKAEIQLPDNSRVRYSESALRQINETIRDLEKACRASGGDPYPAAGAGGTRANSTRIGRRGPGAAGR